MKVPAAPKITSPQLPAVAQPVTQAEVPECEVVPAEEVREGGLQRFLDFYERSAERHPYLTGVTTSFILTFGGDLVAKGIALGQFPISLDVRQLEQLGVIAGLCAYYGLESPEIFRRIDNAYPLEKSMWEAEAPTAPLVEGAEMMTGRRTIWGGMKRMMSSFGRKIVSVKRRIANAKQGIMRAMAYRLGIAPWWTMRHMAFLGLVHGSTATPYRIACDSLILWATWLIPLSVEEYLVQNKIPLRQRFLASSVGCFTWQISASLMVFLSR